MLTKAEINSAICFSDFSIELAYEDKNLTHLIEEEDETRGLISGDSQQDRFSELEPFPDLDCSGFYDHDYTQVEENAEIQSIHRTSTQPVRPISSTSTSVASYLSPPISPLLPPPINWDVSTRNILSDLILAQSSNPLPAGTPNHFNLIHNTPAVTALGTILATTGLLNIFSWGYVEAENAKLASAEAQKHEDEEYRAFIAEAEAREKREREEEEMLDGLLRKSVEWRETQIEEMMERLRRRSVERREQERGRRGDRLREGARRGWRRLRGVVGR